MAIPNDWGSVPIGVQKKIKAALDSQIQEWSNQGWNENDLVNGRLYLSKVLLILAAYDLPISSKKFIEVIHGAANILDIIRDLQDVN